MRSDRPQRTNSPAADPAQPAFVRPASAKLARPAESIALLDGGAHAYPRMLLAIEEAKQSIHLETYAFTASGVGARFIEALTAASKRGVVVRVRMDGWGSVRDGSVVAAKLRRGGCEAEIYNRARSLLLGRLGRNHRKILLVDDEVAFLGGINIGDENLDAKPRLGWADLALEIRGPQCQSLGQLIRHERHRQVQSSLRIYLCGLGGGWKLRRRYIKASRTPRHRVHIAHGYFMPDRAVMHAIIAARQRGVEVRILLPGRSDVPFAVVATRSLYSRLLAVGVEIREWNDSVLHAKVATVDGRKLLVGSFNLDPLSLANEETLVEVSDPHIAEQGEKWIRDHFDRARPMTSTEANARIKRWLFDPMGRAAFRVTAALSQFIAPAKKRRAARSYIFSR